MTRWTLSRDALIKLSWVSFSQAGLMIVGGMAFLPLQAQSQPEVPMPASTISTPTASNHITMHHTALENALLNSTQLTQWLDRFRPPNSGQPRSTGNGSSRSGGLRCNADEPAMQPLLPADNYGWSLAEQPEIFVDVSGTTARQALLIMRSEDGSDYRQAFVPVPKAAGFSGFSLPDSAPLATDQTYQWSLSFICGEYFTLSDPMINGWVRRTESSPAIEQLLSEGSLQEQVQWLSENGYWYDLTARIVPIAQ